MRGLYAIVDVGTLESRRIEPVAFAEAVLSVHPAALQLRAKAAPARETLAMLRTLAPMCHRVGVPLVANDRPDLAILAGCDIVHVGQNDMPIERVRRLTPGIGVGVSTHDAAQLDDALAVRPEYVAFGPVFRTATKSDAEPVVGITSLRGAYARALGARVPLVAIGGITRERASQLVGAADAVAVVGDLVPPASIAAGRKLAEVLDEVAQRARTLHGLFSPQSAPIEAAR